MTVFYKCSDTIIRSQPRYSSDRRSVNLPLTECLSKCIATSKDSLQNLLNDRTGELKPP